MIRKDAWNDFNFFGFTKARFMTQDVIYSGEGPMCTWEKGEVDCFGLKYPLDILIRSSWSIMSFKVCISIQIVKLLVLVLWKIYRAFHPKTINFTFFSSAHGTFSRIDHILGHKSSFDKFRKTEIISSIFSDHSAVRLDVNYRIETIKNTNIWRLNNRLLSNQHITE